MTTENEVHQAFLLIQRVIRKARIDLVDGESTLLSILLSRIGPMEWLRPKDLAEFMFIPMSNVARLLRRCEELDLVKLVPDAEDGRSRLIQLTANGRRAFEREVIRDNEIARNALGALHDLHIATIGRFFDIFGSGLGAPQDPRRVGESEFVHHQMRLARALGMLGADYLGTGIEIAEYQALCALARSDKPMRIKELNQFIALEQSSVSRMLSSLVKKKWLIRAKAPGDARGANISLSDQGKRIFRTLEAKALGIVKDTLATVPMGITSDFLKAVRELERTLREAERGKTRTKLTIAAPKTQNEWYRLRAFFIEVLTERNQHHRLPPELLPERTPTRYAVDEADRIHGLTFRGSKDAISVIVRPGPSHEAAETLLRSAWTRRDSERRAKKKR